MTTGWPDAERPGVPINPERDGAHLVEWITHKKSATVIWCARNRAFYDRAQVIFPGFAAIHLRYLGPCHTPAEVAALVAEARREEREACAAEAMRLRNLWRDGYGQSSGVAYAEVIAAAIRARGAA